MEAEVKSILVNGVEYVQKSELKESAETFEDKKYVICRTYSAGVWAGCEVRKLVHLEPIILDGSNRTACRDVVD